MPPVTARRLFSLIRAQEWDDVMTLLTKQPELCTEATPLGKLALHWVSMKLPPVEVVKLCIAQNEEALRTRDHLGNLPLHYAAENFCPLDSLAVLVEAFPAALLVPAETLRLPLHGAAINSLPLPQVQLLIEAQPMALFMRSRMGSRPISSARGKNKVAIQLACVEAMDKYVEEYRSWAVRQGIPSEEIWSNSTLPDERKRRLLAKRAEALLPAAITSAEPLDPVPPLPSRRKSSSAADRPAGERAGGKAGGDAGSGGKLAEESAAGGKVSGDSEGKASDDSILSQEVLDAARVELLDWLYSIRPAFVDKYRHGFDEAGFEALADVVDVGLDDEMLDAIGVTAAVHRRLLKRAADQLVAASAIASAGGQTHSEVDSAGKLSEYDSWLADGGDEEESPPPYREIAFRELAIGEVIGEGSFSTAYRARWRGAAVVVKRLKQKLDGHQLSLLRQEAAVMDTVGNHPNVVRFCGACTKPPQLALVMEDMAHGSVKQMLDESGPLAVSDVIRMAADVCAGLMHLHSEGIVHRDIAARNLLVDDAMRVKVSDFGLSRILTGAEDSGHTEATTGPLRWMAPETIRKEYSNRSDSWAFAVAVWEMLTAEVPYADRTPLDAAMAVSRDGLRLPLDETWPAALRQLLSDCWQAEPLDRPDMHEVYERLSELSADHK